MKQIFKKSYRKDIISDKIFIKRKSNYRKELYCKNKLNFSNKIKSSDLISINLSFN